MKILPSLPHHRSILDEILSTGGIPVPQYLRLSSHYIVRQRSYVPGRYNGSREKGELGGASQQEA
jgi:hypothetical protein